MNDMGRWSLGRRNARLKFVNMFVYVSSARHIPLRTDENPTIGFCLSNS